MATRGIVRIGLLAGSHALDVGFPGIAMDWSAVPSSFCGAFEFVHDCY
jgi:hypothetical protein